MSYLLKLSVLLIIYSLIQLSSGTPSTYGSAASGAQIVREGAEAAVETSKHHSSVETSKHQSSVETSKVEAAIETAKVGAQAAVETAKVGAEDAVKIAREGAEAAVAVAKEGAVAAVETAKVTAESVAQSVVKESLSSSSNSFHSSSKEHLTKISDTLDSQGKYQGIKGGKVIRPFDRLIDEVRECPRLQDMGAKLLSDREFCDINIELIDPRDRSKQLICAHKSILSMRSSVLSLKIRELLKTQTGTERPILQLEGFEPRVFRWILSYMYLDKLPHEFKIRENIMDLYLEALMLNMTDLLNLSEEHLYTSITTKDAATFLKWAHIHKLSKIKIFILDLIRNTLSMEKSEWTVFLKNLCEAYGYTLSSGTIPIDIEGSNAEITLNKGYN